MLYVAPADGGRRQRAADISGGNSAEHLHVCFATISKDELRDPHVKNLCHGELVLPPDR